MKTLLLLTIALFSASFSTGQSKKENLNAFISMLNESNLNYEQTRVKNIEETSITIWSMSGIKTLQKEYGISNFDLSNLNYVTWHTKEEYDALYPEDSATNADADYITLYFEKGDVVRNNYFTDTDTQQKTSNDGSTYNATTYPDCNFVNIVFKNSVLASQAKEYLDAYTRKGKKKKKK